MDAPAAGVAGDEIPVGVEGLLGRGVGVTLYYQSLDAAQVSYWDRHARGCVDVDGADRLAIRQALRIARKQAAPELLRVQIPAPEQARP